MRVLVGAKKDSELESSQTMARGKTQRHTVLVSRRVNLCIPRAINALFDRLIGRALVGVHRQGSLDLFLGATRHHDPIVQSDLGDSQDAIDLGNVTFDIGH